MAEANKLKIISVAPFHICRNDGTGALKGVERPEGPPLGRRFAVHLGGRVLVFDGPEVIADFETQAPGRFWFDEIHPTKELIMTRESLLPDRQDKVERYRFYDFDGKHVHQINLRRFIDDRECWTRSEAGFEEDGSFFVLAPQNTRTSKFLTWPAETPIEHLGDSKHASDSIDRDDWWFFLKPPTLAGWRTFVTAYPESWPSYTNFKTVHEQFEIGATVSAIGGLVPFNPDGTEFLVQTDPESQEMLIGRYSYGEHAEGPDPDWHASHVFDFKRLSKPANWPYDDPDSEYDRDFPDSGAFYLGSRWAIFRSDFLNRLYLLDTRAMKFVAELEIKGFELGLATERNKDFENRPNPYKFITGGDEQALCSDVYGISRCGEFLLARCLTGTKKEPVNKLVFVKLDAIIAEVERQF